MSHYFNRVTRYIKKNGVLNLLRLVLVRSWRSVFQNRILVFYVDCSDLHNEDFQAPEGLIVECYSNEQDIPPADFDQFCVAQGTRNVVDHLVGKQFHQGRQLWLAKHNDELVGYHWTALKGFDGFWYFPMTSKDAVIFSAATLPSHRGKGIWPAMLRQTLSALKNEGFQRVFVGSKEWNIPSQRSITKAGFHNLGTLRFLYFLGRRITIWSVHKPL